MVKLHFLVSIRSTWSMQSGTLILKIKLCNIAIINIYLSGGGTYDENGKKKGFWVDLDNSFSWYILWDYDVIILIA